MDKVLEPSLKGMLEFTRGYSDEMKMNHRLKALSCTREEISIMAEQVIMKRLEEGETARVVFGGVDGTKDLD
jgi:hypothetical protein